MTRRVSLLLTEDFLREIEEWRRTQEKIPPLNEAIRLLLRDALRAAREDQQKR